MSTPKSKNFFHSFSVMFPKNFDHSWQRSMYHSTYDICILRHRTPFAWLTNHELVFLLSFLAGRTCRAVHAAREGAIVFVDGWFSFEVKCGVYINYIYIFL